jgi:iron-sulfur cluster assembly protein
MIIEKSMLTLTERAVDRVKEQLLHRGKGLGIKLGVRTNGCSGMSYTLAFLDQVDQTLAVYDCGGVHVYMDPKHTVYLNGVEMDWVTKGLNSGFEFNNPNEKGRCGCGESFSV